MKKEMIGQLSVVIIAFGIAIMSMQPIASSVPIA
jgi:hypothetical protein